MLATAVLLPVLQNARRAASAVQCRANMRLLVEGVRLYALRNNGVLPGSPWTSGAEVLSGGGGVSSLTPFDWATPVMELVGESSVQAKPGMGMLAPDGRGARWTALLSAKVMRCPENRLLIEPLDDPTFPLLPAPSYVANLDFLLASKGLRTFADDAKHGSAPSLVDEIRHAGEPVHLPMYYAPRLEPRRLGDFSRKAFFVEWMNPRLLVSDRLAYPTKALEGQEMGGLFASVRMYAVRARREDPPSVFLTGNDADPTVPPESGSLSQGVSSAGIGRRQAWGESMLMMLARHGSSRRDDPLSAYRLHVAFLDGHIALLPVIEAMNPIYHSPRGTEVEVSRTWVYPRVIVEHLAGKERRTYTVK